MMSFNALLRRFVRSKKGNIAIITGLMMPCIVGFCGLATEMAYWYYRHRDVQAAADIAAYGGALMLRQGAHLDEITLAAKASAAQNGWRQANGTITVNSPPTSGTHQNDLSVEVILQENQQRYFSRFFFGNTTAPIGARAVGSYASDGTACFLSLHPSASHAMEFWGNATANFQSCNVVSNSNADDGLAVGGSANVSVPCAQVVGMADITANLMLTDCTTPTEGVEPTPDPYEDLPEPTSTMGEACANSTPAGGNYTPGRYCGGVDINGTATFAPGIYVIDGGDFRLNANSVASGTGVMFFLTNGAHIDFRGGAEMNFSAQPTGTYHGILIFVDRDTPYGNNTLNGNATSVLTGAIYAPSQHVRFLGSYSGYNGCMQVVSATMQYTGNATFGTNCANTGLYQIPTPGAISLAE